MRKHTISFKNAATGILTAARTQINIRIHLLAAAAVFILGDLLRINLSEALILLIAVAIVMTAEMVNTSIEFMCDAVTREKNEYIRDAKDVSAGAVLVSAIFAAIIGSFIFVPKIIALGSL